VTDGVRVYQTIAGRAMYKDAPSAYITVDPADLMEVEC